MRTKYHYFYKIINLINGHFYYGIHSTNNLNDNYFGSGVRLGKAIKKYGKNNFEKIILKFFDNREELEQYEKLIVNEILVKEAGNFIRRCPICQKILPWNHQHKTCKKCFYLGYN